MAHKIKNGNNNLPNSFNNMNEVIEFMGYGILHNANEYQHACGTTNTGVKIWLPIMYSGEEWQNTYNNETTKEYIIQKPIGAIANNRWKVGPLLIPTRVIERYKINNDTIYKDIGEYCTILYDRLNKISIHARIDNPFASGDDKNSNRFYYSSGFAENENQAFERLNLLNLIP